MGLGFSGTLGPSPRPCLSINSNIGWSMSSAYPRMNSRYVRVTWSQVKWLLVQAIMTFLANKKMMAGDRATLWCVFKTQKHNWTINWFRNAVEDVTCRILLLILSKILLYALITKKKMITVPTGLIKLTRSSPPSREPVELVLGEKNGLQRRLVLIIGYKHFIVH